MSLQIALSARTRVREVSEDPGLDMTAGLSVTLLPHIDGGLVHPTVDGPVLSPLPVTESDGEPTEVPVDDLNTVVRRAGDVEDIGAAGDHLSLHPQSATRVVNHNIYHGTQSQSKPDSHQLRPTITVPGAAVEKEDKKEPCCPGDD